MPIARYLPKLAVFEGPAPLCSRGLTDHDSGFPVRSTYRAMQSGEWQDSFIVESKTRNGDIAVPGFFYLVL